MSPRGNTVSINRRNINGDEKVADARLEVKELIELEKVCGLKVLNPTGETYQLG